VYKFLSTLTPEQWAILAGFLAPVIHYFTTKWISFESKHRTSINVAFAIVIPFLFTMADYLAHNQSFLDILPVYGTIFTTAQLTYYGVVRKWKQVKFLELQLNNLINPPSLQVVPTVVQPEVIV
jgi:hypothetical protein